MPSRSSSNHSDDLHPTPPPHMHHIQWSLFHSSSLFSKESIPWEILSQRYLPETLLYNQAIPIQPSSI